ncbi:unnamed protein product, partial [Iphiclides podalirius]
MGIVLQRPHCAARSRATRRTSANIHAGNTLHTTIPAGSYVSPAGPVHCTNQALKATVLTDTRTCATQTKRPFVDYLHYDLRESAKLDTDRKTNIAHRLVIFISITMSIKLNHIVNSALLHTAIMDQEIFSRIEDKRSEELWKEDESLAKVDRNLQISSARGLSTLCQHHP